MEHEKLKSANLKAKKVVTPASITKSSNFRPKPKANNLNSLTEKAKKGDKESLTTLVSAFINAKN